MKKLVFLSTLTALVPAYHALAYYSSATAKSESRKPHRVCSTPMGWKEVVAKRPRYVVFGEVHGTREAPSFVASLACAISAGGDSVLVAIEHEATDNAALQTAWRTSHGDFGHALRAVGWKGRLDGIASKAMFAMLMRLHALKERGHKINIVAFNGFINEAQRERFAQLPGQGSHEAAQAENIFNAAEAGNYNQVLVLVGNFHAQKSALENGIVQFDPMAKRLERYGTTISLNMRFAKGSGWLCQAKPGARTRVGQSIPRGGITCGVAPLPGDKNLNRAPFVQLGRFPGDPSSTNYDGFAWIGAVAGSPPLLK